MDSEHELEVIREQMHQTRASLSDKLEALETQVRDTIQNATSAVNTTVEEVKEVVGSVSDTVSSVKDSVTETAQNVQETVTDTVQSTIDAVKDTFDLPAHVEAHPWAAVGCAVGVGFVGGLFLGPSEKAAPAPAAVATGVPAPAPVPVPAPAPTLAAPTPGDKGEPSVLDRAEEGLGKILKSAAGLGIAALFGVAREMISSAVPQQLKGDLNRLIDDLSTGLGGKKALSSTELKSVLPEKKEEAPAAVPRPEERPAAVRPTSGSQPYSTSRQRAGSGRP